MDQQALTMMHTLEVVAAFDDELFEDVDEVVDVEF